MSIRLVCVCVASWLRVTYTYDVASLEQLTGKLEQILTEQAAALDVLTAAEQAGCYEDLARELLDREGAVEDSVELLELEELLGGSTAIELDPVLLSRRGG